MTITLTRAVTRRGMLKALGIGAAAALIEEPVRKLWFVGSNAPVGSRIERLEATTHWVNPWTKEVESLEEPIARWADRMAARVVPYDGGDKLDAETMAKIDAWKRATAELERVMDEQSYPYKHMTREELFAGAAAGGKTDMMIKEPEREMRRRRQYTSDLEVWNHDAGRYEEVAEVEREALQLSVKGGGQFGFRSAEPGTSSTMAARLEQASRTLDAAAERWGLPTPEQNAVDRKVREIADAPSRGGKTEALLAEYERTLRGMTHNALLKGEWYVLD